MMVGDCFCNFERFERPTDGTLETVEKGVLTNEKSLSKKLEQIGASVQSDLFDKGMTEDKEYFLKKEKIDQLMGDIHYYMATLRGLVSECVELEKKAGIKK